jgi:superfamily II DNA or RNA helicase
MAPTGAGKTYLALRLCNEALQRGRRVVFICDRKTLINQTSAAADGYGMPPHGIIQADNPRMALWRPFQIASAQTLAIRGVADDFDVVVVDECHTLHDSTTEFIGKTKAAVVGLSATPFTTGLGAIYSRVINAATMAELVEQGTLTPMRVLSCVRPDMKGAKTTGGEWTARAAEQRGMGLVGDVVKEWLTHASALKTIVFGPTVVHCEALRTQFAAAGIRAELFTAHTTDAERRDLLEEYRKSDSRIRVLISVEALAKGFDVPDVGCVCDCRPLRKSLSTFIQMVGRGLRSSPGKTECLLLDFSGNIIRFADDFADIYFNGLAELDSGEKLDREVRKDEEKPVRKCPSCGYEPMGRRCVRCGFEPKRVSTTEVEEGEAVEVDVLRSKKGTPYAPTLATLYAAIVTTEKGKAAARVAQGRAPGNPKGAAAHRYREITGEWPPRHYDFASTPLTVPSRELQGKLRSLDLAFFKGVLRKPRSR